MVDKVLKKVNEKVAKKLNIFCATGCDLRMKRSDKHEVAKAHCKLVLFINDRGSLCHAMHPNGTFIAMKSPRHLHDCTYIEFATNHFINTMREVMRGT